MQTFKRDAVLLIRKFKGVEGDVSRSWFGGRPKLSEDMEWPISETGEPLHFVAQIDCAELIGLTDLMLPYSGQLAFFTSQIPIDEGIRVLHVHEGIERKEPEGLLPMNCKLGRHAVPSEIIKDMPEKFRYGLSFQKWPLVIKGIESRYKFTLNDKVFFDKQQEETSLVADDSTEWIEEFKKSFEFYPQNYQPDGSGAGMFSLGFEEEMLDAIKYGYIPKNTDLWPFTNEGLASCIRFEVSELMSEFGKSIGQEDPDSNLTTSSLTERIKSLYNFHERLMHDDPDNKVSSKTVLDLIILASTPLHSRKIKTIDKSFTRSVLADVTRHAATDRLDKVPKILISKLMPTICGRSGNSDSLHQIGGFSLRHYDSGFEASKKALLLQLDCDHAMGWVWGDCDSLKFWISHEHLRNRNFSMVQPEE